MDMREQAELVVKQAMQSPGEEVEYGTTSEQAKGQAKKFVVVKRKASVLKALKQAAKKPRTEAVSSASGSQEPFELPAASLAQIAGVSWMVANKVNATVHFVDADLPWCQRKQRRPVPIKNLAGQGSGVESAKSLNMPFCPTCRRMFTVAYGVEIESQ